MDRSSSSAQSGPKVSQIANIFQRNPIEISPERSHFHHHQPPVHHVHSQNQKTTVTVVRTESHSTRFNNARALFEKLGESNSLLSLKMSRSGSREDNLDSGGGGEYQLGMSPPKIRTPFPSGINTKPQNGIASKITNISRLKSRIETDGPALDNKPEKPERKFNSRELIEKQKKWQSHFTKTKPNRSHSDPNRCDIIRTVPGTALIPGSSINNNQNQQTTSNVNNNKSFEYDEQESEEELDPEEEEEKPPNPPIRHSIHPPEVKPRSCAKITSPVTSPPLPPIPPAKPKLPIRSPEKINRMSDPPPPVPQSPSKVTAAIYKSVEDLPPRRKSIEFVEETPPPHNGFDQKRPSIDMVMSTTSSSPAPSASSGPSSPAHTEDEKQENESTEKLDNVGVEVEVEPDVEVEEVHEDKEEVIVVVPDGQQQIVEQEDEFGE